MKNPASKKNAISRRIPLIEEREITSDLYENKGSSLFLGRYSISEVIAVLGKRNLLREARKRKLWPLVYELDSSEYPLQRLMIFFGKKRPENLIVDLKIKEELFFQGKGLMGESSPHEYKFLILEWLTLQNPLQSFSPEKPPLPGQSYPGLNLGKKAMDIFLYLAQLTKKDGILACPAYFHNALLFSRYFYFLNPEKEAEVTAIKKLSTDITFKQLAWVVHLNCLRDEENKIYEWKGEEQIYPVHRILKKYFESKSYRGRVNDSLGKFHFRVDWDCYRRKIKQADSKTNSKRKSQNSKLNKVKSKQ